MAAQGRYRDALALIKKENPFPAVCGRICNRRCEDACTRGTVDQAVAIDAVKKFVAQQDLNAAMFRWWSSPLCRGRGRKKLQSSAAARPDFPARTSLRFRATARLYLRKTNTLAACCGTASPALSWKKM